MSNSSVWTETIDVDEPAAETRADETIVARVRGGERELFAVLYARHRRRVYRLAYGMTARREAAEDLTQEIFMRAYDRLAQFRNEANFATWLHRLAINCCLNDRRREAARVGDAGSFVEEAASEERLVLTGDDAADAERDAWRAQIKRKVHDALQSLPPELRVVVVLRDIEGFSYDEIAERLACSSGTVASRLNRARRLLACKLEDLRGRV